MDKANNEYVLDKLVERLDDFGEAREVIEEYDDEELVSLVYSLSDDLLDLKHDEFVVYTTARDVLFERGYGFNGDGALVIVDPEGTPVV